MITALFYCLILLISDSDIGDSTKVSFYIVFILESWGFTIMLINNLG